MLRDNLPLRSEPELIQKTFDKDGSIDFVGKSLKLLSKCHEVLSVSIEPFHVCHADLYSSSDFVVFVFQLFFELFLSDCALITAQSEQVLISRPVKKLDLTGTSSLAEAVFELNCCLGRAALDHQVEVFLGRKQLQDRKTGTLTANL